MIKDTAHNENIIIMTIFVSNYRTSTFIEQKGVGDSRRNTQKYINGVRK